MPTMEKGIASRSASRSVVGTTTCITRSYREIICLSVSPGQRPPGFGVGPLYCEFRAIIVGRPTSGTCTAYNFRQRFESSAPVLGPFALPIPNQRFQLAAGCWPLRGCHTKHNSFSWDSKPLANKILDYGCRQPCTSNLRASDTLPAVWFQFMVPLKHRMSRRNAPRYSQRRSNHYGNPKG